MELEEEKKTQAEWEKRVKEQAKKIENLSSMVLFSNRDESREHIKKVLLITNACTYQVYFFEWKSLFVFSLSFFTWPLSLNLLCLGYILQINLINAVGVAGLY